MEESRAVNTLVVGPNPTPGAISKAVRITGYANRKHDLLGMNFSTASQRLRKQILFSFAQETGKDMCFRCEKRIETAAELSIEHKEAWASSPDPVSTFFDLKNIGFSHLPCNTRAASKPNKKYFTAEERHKATREGRARNMRRNYSTEKRRSRYESTGW